MGNRVRSFLDVSRVLDPVPACVVQRLRQIDRSSGREDLYSDQLPGLLEELATQARVRSVQASSAIEGIEVATARAERIIRGQAQRLRSRGEQELAGYRDALDDPLACRRHLSLTARTERTGCRVAQADGCV